MASDDREVKNRFRHSFDGKDDGYVLKGDTLGNVKRVQIETPCVAVDGVRPR